MLVLIDDLLTPDELATARALLTRSQWAHGNITAGTQSAQVKNNQQLAEDAEHLPALRRLVLGALNCNALFFTAVLPRRIFPPLFNRYAGTTNSFGNHVDNAMRPLPDGSGYLRTDVSTTLFLNEPDEYDGGELENKDSYGSQVVKPAAGGGGGGPAAAGRRGAPV